MPVAKSLPLEIKPGNHVKVRALTSHSANAFFATLAAVVTCFPIPIVFVFLSSLCRMTGKPEVFHSFWRKEQVFKQVFALHRSSCAGLHQRSNQLLTTSVTETPSRYTNVGSQTHINSSPELFSLFLPLKALQRLIIT